jgi:hypothetical protein
MSAIRAAVPESWTKSTIAPNLILPGLIDTHLHFPQTQVIGSYGANLLEWLNTYIFPKRNAVSSKARMPPASRVISYDEMIRERHDDGRRLLLRAQGLGRRLFCRSAEARHVHGRRQGDDGPQCPAGPARHAADGL